jgi:hypothetical protein
VSRKRLFGIGRFGPPIVRFAATTDLTGLLKEIQLTTAKESDNWSKWARNWGSWSVVLAVLATLGSGAAGASVVAIANLSGGAKAVVALLAFAGAALSGIAAAVGAPSQAANASRRGDQFSSLERWAGLAVVELPTLTSDEAQARVRELLTWRDQILGVNTPTSLSTGVDSSSPIPPAGGAVVPAPGAVPRKAPVAPHHP